MKSGKLGLISTPSQGNRLLDGVPWCADNGKFGRDWRGPERWWAWLIKKSTHAEACVFACAPDVVGDAEATLLESAEWLPRIRSAGYPAALVAQDGLESLVVPWDDFDALFIGGTTEWKLGPHAETLIHEAKDRGKWVHMGRVNSRKRWLYAQALGCDSCDGTYLTYGPDVNLPKLLSWVEG